MGLLAAGAALTLSACTPEFGSEPETVIEPSTPPTWCPTAAELQETLGDDLGTWAYDDDSAYDCLLKASTEEEWLTGLFSIVEQDDDWWAEVSIPPHGLFETYRMEPIGDSLALAWSGADKEAQGTCHLLMPGQEWILDFSGTGNGGACDLILDIHQTLEV